MRGAPVALCGQWCIRAFQGQFGASCFRVPTESENQKVVWEKSEFWAEFHSKVWGFWRQNFLSSRGTKICGKLTICVGKSQVFRRSRRLFDNVPSSRRFRHHFCIVNYIFLHYLLVILAIKGLSFLQKSLRKGLRKSEDLDSDFRWERWSSAKVKHSESLRRHPR